jgi:hypothetical protein
LLLIFGRNDDDGFRFHDCDFPSGNVLRFFLSWRENIAFFRLRYERGLFRARDTSRRRGIDSCFSILLLAFEFEFFAPLHLTFDLLRLLLFPIRIDISFEPPESSFDISRFVFVFAIQETFENEIRDHCDSDFSSFLIVDEEYRFAFLATIREPRIVAEPVGRFAVERTPHRCRFRKWWCSRGEA